jgi:hypothetical protein
MQIHADEVKTDEEAFEQILKRLTNDVGTILGLVRQAKDANREFHKTAPFYAIARMLFPIAESIGDLVYRNNNSTSANLTSILENEFEVVRPGYQGKAAIVAELFRHSLTHTDELRVLQCNARKVGWSISWNEETDHLKLTRGIADEFQFKFDTTAFYEDVVKVLQSAAQKSWQGEVMKRYNGWLTLDLSNNPRGAGRTKAINEIKALN